MRIESARVQNYRCVRDSGPFDIEWDKTILVGINEAGKTAILRGIQQASPSLDAAKIDWLYDAPAALVDDIRRGRIKQGDLPVATVTMRPEATDLAGLSLPGGAESIRLVMTSSLDNERTYAITGLPAVPTVSGAEKSVIRLASAMGKQADDEAKDVAKRLTQWKDDHAGDRLQGSAATALKALLDEALPLFAEGSAAEGHWDALTAQLESAAELDKVGKHLLGRMPPFVYFSSYFSVRPRIHLNRLAERQASGELDMAYDFGNLQLLRFLGFTAQELSEMESKAPEKGHSTRPTYGFSSSTKTPLSNTSVGSPSVRRRSTPPEADSPRRSAESGTTRVSACDSKLTVSTCKPSSKTTLVSWSNWTSAVRASAGSSPSSLFSTPRPQTVSERPCCSSTNRD